MLRISNNGENAYYDFLLYPGQLNLVVCWLTRVPLTRPLSERWLRGPQRWELATSTHPSLEVRLLYNSYTTVASLFQDPSLIPKAGCQDPGPLSSSIHWKDQRGCEAGLKHVVPFNLSAERYQSLILGGARLKHVIPFVLKWHWSEILWDRGYVNTCNLSAEQY